MSMEDVLIFKTNVECESDVKRASALLKSTNQITRWNFDLCDCDKILRVVSSGLRPQVIENLLKSEGIYCENLTYEL